MPSINVASLTGIGFASRGARRSTEASSARIESHRSARLGAWSALALMRPSIDTTTARIGRTTRVKMIPGTNLRIVILSCHKTEHSRVRCKNLPVQLVAFASGHDFCGINGFLVDLHLENFSVLADEEIHAARGFVLIDVETIFAGDIAAPVA